MESVQNISSDRRKRDDARIFSYPFEHCRNTRKYVENTLQICDLQFIVFEVACDANWGVDAVNFAAANWC